MRLLFVCSMGLMRSATAVKLLQGLPNLEVRNAGILQGSRHKLNTKRVAWATDIICFERKHAQRVTAFGGAAKIIQVLDIKDEYGFMNKELILMLKEKLKWLEREVCGAGSLGW